MPTSVITPDVGPISLDELLELWRGAVDELYAQALLDKGDGHGLEAFGQAFAQLERISRAIDVSTQAMFIQPWSGQSNEPAAGPANATVVLTFTRTGHLDLPMVLTGSVPVEERITDWGELPGDAGQAVLTDRRYRLSAPLVFPPGVAGPLTATATAEGPGWGFNNPLPGSISNVDQVAGDFLNTGASVLASGAIRSMQARGVPDVFVPDHVGQYVLLTAGANAGKAVRVIGYSGPVGTDGGTVLVEREVAFEGTTAGTFRAGETVHQATTNAEGVYLGGTSTFLVVAARSGTFDGTNVLTGLSSTATFTPSSIVLDDTLAAESGTAAWRMFRWDLDWGMTVTNEASPSGGRLGFLDELGHERNVPRGPGENDDQYRDRVSKPADVVSPNAFIRAANRVLAPVGLTGCFREAGQEGIPGFFFDADDRWDENESFTLQGLTPFNAFFEGEEVRQLDPATGKIAHGKAVTTYVAPGNPFDTILDGVDVEGGTFQENLTIVGQRSGATYLVPPGTFVGLQNGSGVAAADRYRYLFDYLEMRAFFLETVPRVNFGEFGFAFDAGPFGFFDDYPYFGFFDGFAASAANFYRTVWIAQDKVKAGGVGHDLAIDDGPCP